MGKTAITLDGYINEASWLVANELNEFQSPWLCRDLPMTKFKATWNKEYLFFAFIVQDDDIVLVDKIENETDIGGEDRVEMFFANAPIDKSLYRMHDVSQLSNYYSIEIDAMGRVLDLSAQYYRKFDFSWLMKGLETKASRDNHGYQVEGRIPLAILKELELIGDNGKMLFGVFRGEFWHSDNSIESQWISWVDPLTAQPDFHVMSAFGYLVFVE